MADDYLAVADLLGDALDLSDADISDLRDAAPLVARLPAEESSNGETHKYVKETGAPVVGFRAPNAGRDFDSSADTVVTVTLKVLDFSWAVDKAIADVWRKGGAEALIAREGFRHIKAALFHYEKQLIYGTGADASGFAGLADNAQLNQASDAMVIDAGGTTAATGSSVFFIRMGRDNCQAIYKGESTLMLGETVIQDFLDGSNMHYPAYYTPGCTWLGMQIGGAYSVGRIASITEDPGATLTDDLGYEMLSLFPPGQRSGMIAVMNARSIKQLRESRTATNATGVAAPWPADIAGVPIVETDAILNTETLL